jgi:hypothetical protein
LSATVIRNRVLALERWSSGRRFVSNSKFEGLIRRDIQFKSFNHEIEQMIPAIEVEVAGESANVIEKGVADGQRLAPELVLVIYQQRGCTTAKPFVLTFGFVLELGQLTSA